MKRRQRHFGYDGDVSRAGLPDHQFVRDTVTPSKVDGVSAQVFTIIFLANFRAWWIGGLAGRDNTAHVLPSVRQGRGATPGDWDYRDPEKQHHDGVSYAPR